jgi:hypothetical protein
MKTYIVYVNGIEVGYIKAGSHNSAEKKAKEKYGQAPPDGFFRVMCNDVPHVSVAYTEI